MQETYYWDSQKAAALKQHQLTGPAWRSRTPMASALCSGDVLCRAGCERQIFLPLCLKDFHSPGWGGAAPAWVSQHSGQKRLP